MNNHIGTIHLCCMMIENVYGFIIEKNNLFDRLYIVSFVCIPFSWIICKDECIISYLVKKIENKNYILGSEPDNVEDISRLFTNKKQYMVFYNMNVLLRLGSVVIVNMRTTKIDYFTMVPACIFYLLYNYDITYKLNYRQKMYPFFQIIFSVYVFAIIYKTVVV